MKTKLTPTEKELLKASQEITKLRKLLYQVEVFMEQNNMNSKYDGVWRDDDAIILRNVKKESEPTFVR